MNVLTFDEICCYMYDMSKKDEIVSVESYAIKRLQTRIDAIELRRRVIEKLMNEVDALDTKTLLEILKCTQSDVTDTDKKASINLFQKFDTPITTRLLEDLTTTVSEELTQ